MGATAIGATAIGAAAIGAATAMCAAAALAAVMWAAASVAVAAALTGAVPLLGVVSEGKARQALPSAEGVVQLAHACGTGGGGARRAGLGTPHAS